jgi:hypothetical protein
MAISSFKSFLMKGSGSTSLSWAKLVDIKEFPDLGGVPEQLETTTLSDPGRTYIPGIQNTETKSITCNYTATDFATLDALKGTEQYVAIYFGGTESGGVVTPTGSDGIFEGKAYIDVFVAGAGVNEVVNMTVTLTMTKNFTKVASASTTPY